VNETVSSPLLCEAERPGRVHAQILAVAWAGWVFDFYDLVLFSFLLIPVGHELALSRMELSAVFGSTLAATALGGIAFGALADRFGRRTILQATILTYSIGTFLCGLAPGLGWLLVFRAVTGIGVGGEWATGQAYICETFPAKFRGRYAAYMQTGAPIGVALASIVGGFLAPRIGWRPCFFLSGLPALLTVFIRRKLPESDLWLARRPASKERGKGPGPGAEIFSARFRGVFLRCLVLSVLTMSAYWFVYSWLPGYLHDERNFSMARSAVWLLVTQAGGLLGYASFGAVSDRIGRRPAFTIYSLLFSAGLVPVSIFWTALSAHPSRLLSCMFLVGFGTGVWSGFGPLFSELFPTEIRNTAMGAAYNLARGAQFLTPILIAWLSPRWGLGGGIALAALFSAGTAGWIWTFSETNGARLS
jgi:MFS family permease